MNTRVKNLFSKIMLKNFLLKLLYKFGLWLPDDIYLRILFYLQMGKTLHLKKPKTFSEKIQWLKLHNRKPEYTMMVDKFAVKEYVAGIIGEQYIIPTLGVWDKPEEIDWDNLPDRFVLKTTNGGGSKGVVICKNKVTFDKANAIQNLNAALRRDIYKRFREWPYKNVPKRIIAEQYMEDSRFKDLRDYKFFCFNGEVKALFVATERQSAEEETRFDFFDANFNHLNFRNGHPNADNPLPKPEKFEKMKDIASKLSQNIPQVRVDLYDVDGNIYFGEMTFFHWSGLKPFEPEEWDRTFGEWIKLPESIGRGKL